jgi:hypothetical protein
MMPGDEDPASRCANDGCARRALPGETLCGACCLDQALFRRDLRQKQIERRESSEGPPRPAIESEAS